MHRLFSDLVVSRDGATARRAGLAFPASLVLHAAAATVVVLVAVLRQDALPRVETTPGPIREVVALPPAGGGNAIRPSPPRLPRPSPPPSMAFVSDLPPTPTNEGLDVPSTVGTEPFESPPCLIGCDPGGVPGGEPGGGVIGVVALPPAPQAPIRTGGDIRPPLKVRHVVPPYPEVARAARVQGDVVLDCTISNEGRVVDVKVLSGPIVLQAAAVDAVRQWLYRPTLLNGAPVPVVMTVTVHFALDPRR
jgi:protein TonB